MLAPKARYLAARTNASASPLARIALASWSAVQMEAEKERQTELAQLRWNASIDMQRLMRGWYARGFADLAKMHRDGATCIQCFVRYTFANRLVKQVRETKRINFESSSTIQRSEKFLVSCINICSFRNQKLNCFNMITQTCCCKYGIIGI